MGLSDFRLGASTVAVRICGVDSESRTARLGVTTLPWTRSMEECLATG